MPALAAAAVRALSEEVFHRRHADALLDGLLSVPDARARLLRSLHNLLPLGIALFDGVAGEAVAVAEGAISGPLVGRLPLWRQRVEARFGPIDWASVVPMATSHRTERHGDFDALLSRMLEVWELDRSARW